jgi:chromosome segregation protein
VFLKSLTLRGFKSFAEKAVLEFEPGVTVIVGPNGSGKSNVVDAIAWVLGEQGVKALRGGKMDDVIFGGAGNRAPLGRAEVALTIDNTSGLLPIDYSEVTISRLLYRSGESEYAINGSACRLLDIQELLSDTGVGRELHTIIGQGHLDEVLHGRPEDRRAAIEEAAGIYKHRRRKDRALRKLAGVEQQLVRLSDLVSELRRQLKPLQQQAETARRAAEVQAELREVRLTLRSRELAAVRAEAIRAETAQQALAGRLAELEAAAGQAQAAEAAAGQALAATEPREARARETVHRLATVRERLRGTLALAEERARSLAQPLADDTEGRSPQDMLREAGEVAGELAEVDAQLDGLADAVEAAGAARAAARAALAGFDAAQAAGERARADALRRTVQLQGEAVALRQALDRAAEEGARLTARADELTERSAAARARLEVLQAEAGELEAREIALSDVAAAAESIRAAAAVELDELRGREHEYKAGIAATRAARDAHEAAARAAGGDALTALQAGDRPGLVGPLAPTLAVEAGYEAAVAAALGPAAAAVLVSDADAAEAAVIALAETGSGRAVLLHEPADAPELPEAAPDLPRLAERVRAAEPATAIMARLLADVLVADNLADARALLAKHPGHRVVTRAGELVADGRLEGGATPASGALAARRAALEAAADHERLDAELAGLSQTVTAAADRLAAAQAEVKRAAAALNESDAAISAAADRLARAGEEHRLLERELAAVTARQAELDGAGVRDRNRLEQVGAELAAAAPDQDETGAEAGDDGRAAGPGTDRATLAAAVEHAGERATEAQVALSTLRERRRLLAGREAGLRERATAEEAAERRRAGVRAARLAAARAAREAAGLAHRVLGRLEQSLSAATAERDRLLTEVGQARAELAVAREGRTATTGQLEALRARAHGADSAQLEARMRDDDLARRLVEEFGIDPDQAIAEYVLSVEDGPEGAQAPTGGAADHSAGAADDGAGAGPGQGPVLLAAATAKVGPDGVDPRRLPDAELRRAGAALDRRLALLGRVNPLALEDFKALEERHGFLAGQLADLKDSRRDLLKVVRAVDTRVREVFGQAFEDVAREFERTFTLLFPGGEGRLVLTDPEDMLTTGIEVEARPPGKRLRRLSLLSGGERSLVALAFCFAVFRARPSPFYVLDEVEAALDDVNLRRFLALLDDIRDQAQLLVVSHQRRTMEAADALYGISMQAAGVSKVLSQRLHQGEMRERRAVGRQAVAEIDPDAVELVEPDEPDHAVAVADDIGGDIADGMGGDTAVSTDGRTDGAGGNGAGDGRVIDLTADALVRDSGPGR